MFHHINWRAITDVYKYNHYAAPKHVYESNNQIIEIRYRQVNRFAKFSINWLSLHFPFSWTAKTLAKWDFYRLLCLRLACGATQKMGWEPEKVFSHWIHQKRFKNRSTILFSPNFRTARPLQCGGTSRQKHLEMQNPSRLPAECVYKIQPLNLNVCQLRVDFDLILQQPTIRNATEKGVPKCETDSFSVFGLELCGMNRNQHSMTSKSPLRQTGFCYWYPNSNLFVVYIPVSVSRDSRNQVIELKLKIADRTKNPTLGFVSWNIRVSQLECARGIPSVISGKMLNDSFEPMNPVMARAIANDVDRLGKSILHAQPFDSILTHLLSLDIHSTSRMLAIPHGLRRNNRIIQF